MVDPVLIDQDVQVTGIAIHCGEWKTPAKYFSAMMFAENFPSPSIEDRQREQIRQADLVKRALMDAGAGEDKQKSGQIMVIPVHTSLGSSLETGINQLLRHEYQSVVLVGGNPFQKAAVVLSLRGEKILPHSAYARVTGLRTSQNWADEVVKEASQYVIRVNQQGVPLIRQGESSQSCAIEFQSDSPTDPRESLSIFVLLRLILSLYFRSLPAHQSEVSEISQDSYFYLNRHSRRWFRVQTEIPLSASLVESADRIDRVVHFTESSHAVEPYCLDYLDSHFLPKLILISGQSESELIDSLQQLKIRVMNGETLHSIAIENYKTCLNQKGNRLSLSLIGLTSEDILREADSALKGIKAAFLKSIDWQTPAGSYFSPDPLGERGKIAFVYPGAFNSYPWMAKDLFYLFPHLYRRLEDLTPNVGSAVQEKLIYPRFSQVGSKEEDEKNEVNLMSNAVAMLTSGTALSFLYTVLLTEIFKIQPAASFGYSLGETSMMFASGVWSDGFKTQTRLTASPLFRTRLAGPQNTIREYWKRKGLFFDPHSEELWANYILMCEPGAVLQQLSLVEKVYLTHINTPRQVVIGGDPSQCRKVISSLKCSHLKAPFSYALHCDPVLGEFKAFVELFSWPVAQKGGEKLYTAATYAPMHIDPGFVAASISRTLCTRLDFPKLISRVYQDGCQCFIELGAGSNCAKWIDESLKTKPHISLGINRKGLDDFSSILRVIARLVSHKYPVNLAPLFDGIG